MWRLALGLFLALTTTAAAEPHLDVLVDRVARQQGLAIVPVRCEGGPCEGTLGSQEIAVRRDGATYVSVKAPGGELSLRVRLEGAPTQRLRLPVRTHRDRTRCGYGPLAAPVRQAQTARLLAVRREGLDDLEDTEVIVVCRQGVSRALRETYQDLGGFEQADALSLSDTWAGVVSTSLSHYNEGEVRLTVMRLADGRRFGRAVNIIYEGGPIAPTPTALAIGDAGGIVIGQDAGEPQIRVIDSAGDRIVDSGAGIDLGSLSAGGDTGFWRHDGTSASATLGASPFARARTP